MNEEFRRAVNTLKQYANEGAIALSFAGGYKNKGKAARILGAIGDVSRTMLIEEKPAEAEHSHCLSYECTDPEHRDCTDCNQATAPVGSVIPSQKSSSPRWEALGWLWCPTEGSWLDKSAYPDLWIVLGTQYGVAGRLFLTPSYSVEHSGKQWSKGYYIRASAPEQPRPVRGCAAPTGSEETPIVGSSHLPTEVVLLGGPFAGQKVTLRWEPEFFILRGVRYERINDPDTGASLGGYVATEEQQ